MKKPAALILLLAFAAQTFNQGILVVNFLFNQKYIAAKECENRFRPKLHCDGKCQLAKKFKQEEKKEEQNPELKLSAKSEIVSSKSFFTSAITKALPVNSVYNYSSDTRTIDRSYPIFHPPGT